MLRNIFESKSQKEREDWRKLHNEELRDLQSLPIIIDQIKEDRRAGMWHVWDI